MSITNLFQYKFLLLVKIAISISSIPFPDKRKTTFVGYRQRSGVKLNLQATVTYFLAVFKFGLW
jgi:hypothetical protein